MMGLFSWEWSHPQLLLRLCMSRPISLFPICLHSVWRDCTQTIHTPRHMTFLLLTRIKQKALPKYWEMPEPNYAGVSKSCRTQVVTKHMLTFVTCRHWPHSKNVPPEFRQRVWYFYHCWKYWHNWLFFFKLHVAWSVTVLKFHEYPGNNALTAVTSFSERRRNHKGPNQASKEGRGPQPCFWWPKIAAQTMTVCTSTLSLWTNQLWFHHCSDVLSRHAPSDVAKPPGSNSLFGLKKQFLRNNTPRVNSHQHALHVWPHLPCFLWTWRGRAFSLK